MTPIKVNAANFVRAETDRMFAGIQANAGGVNAFEHNRAPAAIDNQTVIRLNRDTLYSFAVADLSNGATLTVPDTDGRYLSVMIVNQDHYINRVFHTSGTYELTTDDFDTDYVLIAARTLVDPRNPDDMAKVATIQDQITLTAGSATTFTMPDYDPVTFTRTRDALLTLAHDMDDFAHSFGRGTEVDPIRHLIGAAAGWGGLPDAEATYVGVAPDLPVGEYELRVPDDVPVDGFWSISVYNAAGYFEPNAADAYTLNNITAAREDDGSVIVRFGGTGNPTQNSIPLTEGWNYLVRLYRPRPEILDGTWTFPTIT